MSRQRAQRTVITGTGSYIPTERVPNSSFLDNQFFAEHGRLFEGENEHVTRKLEEITEIKERRYVSDDLVTSDIASFAAEKAVESSGIDREELDYVIVAHNFGDVRADNRRSDFVPSLAARVKHQLGISNPWCVAYDLPFGCPGWVQGVTQVDYYFRSGDASSALVIGAETLSRVSDPHDRDSMIYADGAGAVVLEARETTREIGILSHAVRSDTIDHARLLRMDTSYNPEYPDDRLFLKMTGRKLYEYALSTVPGLVKQCLDRAGLDLHEVNKVLLHQANAKMDEAILKRLFRLYNLPVIPEGTMPMTISWLGNSSVATVPTMLDLIMRGQMDGQVLASDDVVVFASVGAGMNTNAFAYRWP